MKLPPKKSSDQWSSGTCRAGTRETHPKLQLLLTTGLGPTTSSMKMFPIKKKKKSFNGDLLFSTENSTQYSVITCVGKEAERE